MAHIEQSPCISYSKAEGCMWLILGVILPAPFVLQVLSLWTPLTEGARVVQMGVGLGFLFTCGAFSFLVACGRKIYYGTAAGFILAALTLYGCWYYEYRDLACLAGAALSFIITPFVWMLGLREWMTLLQESKGRL